MPTSTAACRRRCCRSSRRIVGAALAVLHAFGNRNWPIPAADCALRARVDRRRGLQQHAAALLRHAQRAGARDAVHPAQHRRDATRVRARHRRRARRLRRRAADAATISTRNAATLKNVRLWDHAPLLETFGQIQEIRTYYDFVSVDNDRYHIDGALRQVMLSARELNSASLPARTWVNERLTFTHGYGLTLGPVNEVTSEGLPVLFVRNLPPETIPDLKIDEPSIYFGELSNDYVIVRTRTPEFHYPRGDENETTQYSGRAACSSARSGESCCSRCGSARIRSSSATTSPPKAASSSIVRFASASSASRRSSPSIAIRISCSPKAASTGSSMPTRRAIATRTRRRPDALNYIRNSVKFVVDAYDGTTTAYLSDANDPIAATYARIFPNTFKPLSEMPASIREHVRYPEDIFAIQAQVYATYHMTQPAVYYNREDQWEIPTVDDGQRPECDAAVLHDHAAAR